MKTIKNILDKLGKPRVTIFLFVTLTLSAILIVGNLGEGKLKEITGGIGTLDLRVGYTPEQAYEALTLMGEQGRLFYRNLLIRLDLVFPLINTLFWISLITLIYKNILKKKKALYLIALFPINIFVFDITENILVLNMLANYPKEMFNIAFTLNIITIVKFMAVTISILLSLIGVFILIVKNRLKAG